MKRYVALANVVVALLLAQGAKATTYAYDALGRVTVVTYDNGKQVIYSYDAAGNRTQVVTQATGNLPPVAVADSVSTNSGTPIAVHPLINDSDADGDTLTIQSVITNPGIPGATKGTPVITDPSSTITYTPPALYSGMDSFGYSISDGHGHTASATVNVTVLNQPPVAVADTPTVALNTPTPIDVLHNDSDPENDPISITAVTAPVHGTAVIASGMITYTSTGGSTVPDNFTYTIADDHGNSASAAVTVGFSNANSPPVALNDELDINYTGTLPYTPQANFDPRTNDTDANGDPITITHVGPATLGTTSISSDGTHVGYQYNTPHHTQHACDGQFHLHDIRWKWRHGNGHDQCCYRRRIRLMKLLRGPVR